MRTLVSLRFRNPINITPLQAGPRLQGSLALWNLSALRGTLPEEAMKMYLEDAEGMGIGRGEAADFALTPSCVGGGGVRIGGSGEAALVREGKGRWLKVTTSADVKKITPHLGHWALRLRKFEAVLGREEHDAIYPTLAMSWGLYEHQLYGKVSWEWTEIAQFKSREPPLGPMAPDIRDLWEAGEIPTAIRQHIVRAYVRKASGPPLRRKRGYPN